MPFKIVQTVEDGEVCLSIVPSTWEINGVLRWPKKLRLANKLSHMEYSQPDSSWDRMMCLKKRELNTRKEAEDELSLMELHSDTENEESHPSKRICRTAKDQNKLAIYSQQYDYNNLIPAETKVDDITTPVSLSHMNTKSKIVVLQNDIILPAEENTNNMQQSSIIENGTFDLIHLNNPSDEKLDLILQNQNKIFVEISKLQTSLDIMGNMFTKYAASANTSNNANVSTPTNTIEPIASHDDLKVFEEKLKCKNHFNEVVKSMTFICGNSGKEKGIDCCYRLIDYFINRDLLNKSSWTGSSRKTDAEKIPLKYFEQFRKCFFEIVLCADKDFSLADCDTFFKRILKNSAQRVNSKSKTLSKHKERPKNLVYKKK